MRQIIKLCNEIAGEIEYSITGVHRSSASHTDNYLTGE